MAAPTSQIQFRTPDQAPRCVFGHTFAVPSGDTSFAVPGKTLHWIRDGLVIVRMLGDSSDIKLQGNAGTTLYGLAITMIRGTSATPVPTDGAMEVTVLF